jgi:fructan beta-fructosidase
MNKSYIFLFVGLFILGSCKQQSSSTADVTAEALSDYQEAFRPQYHFTPETKWMNDPNGLVYENGVYHLFYQYYPDAIVWGPMHWGHATSKDLVHWEHQPIALFPDELGYIFSGSAIVDSKNTSGLGTAENPPLIAIYTYHDPKGEKQGRNDFQYQGLAYSLDHGVSWEKYENNPIIPNTNSIRDFRDPKVFWNEQLSAWTVVLVAGDHMQLWKSSNLLDWEYMSDFGKDVGAHGGVWECPDLFELKVEGSDQTKWVLLISINPGAPNGGSGTQYFVGDFDGTSFTTDQKESKWIDLGTDNYAGVTYNGLSDDKRLFIGWMSNWSYAQETPTKKWRSAMTLPRQLGLKRVEEELILTSYPVASLSSIVTSSDSNSFDMISNSSKEFKQEKLSTSKIQFSLKGSVELKLKNEQQEELVVSISDSGFIVIDRSKSGLVDFSENFFAEIKADFIPKEINEVELYVDASSVEIFINKGERVMTARMFNKANYSSLEVLNTTDSTIEVMDFSISTVKRIWD